MHLLVPFAAGRSEAAVAALGTLELPHLASLLRDGEIAWRDEQPVESLSPPHERALARLRGWHGADGALPFAAAALRADGHDPGFMPWAMLVPVHWQLGRDHALLLDPAALALAEAESRGLFERVAELFTSMGFDAVFGAPLRWFVGRDDLEGLPAASPDRAIGLPVEPWLARPAIAAHPASRALKRLLSEAQLVLHAHPVNDEREARGAPAVNALWLHGAGREQPFDAASDPAVDDRLRAPFLGGDWAAWADAWRTLDAGPIAALHAEVRAGRPASIVLCGERHAVRIGGRRRSVWQRAFGERTHAGAFLDSL
jgi:hypothetical protein